jgi:hypothetical protein
MSTETPAAHLARLRVQFGLHYRIEQACDSGRPGYVARHRTTGQLTYAGSPAALEGKLLDQAHSG